MNEPTRENEPEIDGGLYPLLIFPFVHRLLTIAHPLRKVRWARLMKIPEALARWCAWDAFVECGSLLPLR
jgi:hypothetical protein